MYIYIYIYYLDYRWIASIRKMDDYDTNLCNFPFCLLPLIIQPFIIDKRDQYFQLIHYLLFKALKIHLQLLSYNHQ
jgi:hypothetical protein